MNKDLTEEFLVSLGFEKDGYTNLSYDYYLDKKDYSISINLENTPDKSACIDVFNNDVSNKRMVSLKDLKSRPRTKKFTVEDLKAAIKLAEINFEIYALE